MYDEELERFKTEINLVELASSYGYECIRKESSRSSMVLEHLDGDKIVVATGLDGHGIFFSVREDARSGSVIDFVMHRECVQLGRARQVLRKCLTPGYLHSQSKIHFRPEVISQVGIDLYTQWLRMSHYETSGYLEMRGLNAETIAAFADRIRVDGRGNVAFRHDDLKEFTGWELKNRGFTGFTAGGKKALFGCRVGILDKAAAALLVVAESAIDVMSYYQLKPRAGFYLSFAGAISCDQYELLAWIVNRYADAEVVVATDNDVQGDKYAEHIRQLRSDVVRDCPPVGKDWNDTLNNRQALEKR